MEGSGTGRVREGTEKGEGGYGHPMKICGNAAASHPLPCPCSFLVSNVYQLARDSSVAVNSYEPAMSNGSVVI